MSALRMTTTTQLAGLVAGLVLMLTAAALWLAGAPTAGGADGNINTVVGTVGGFAGDGGPADQALIRNPKDIAPTPGGGLLIADSANDRIRRVGADGIISTVAGDGGTGALTCPDDPDATAVSLTAPAGITPLAGGAFLIADSGDSCIRRVNADGSIQNVAGGAGAGLAGDGGAAVGAKLNGPRDIIAMPGGAFLIADTGNHRVRRLSPGGIITTIAGTTQGFSGDGGPAGRAQLDGPRKLTLMPDGAVLVADTGNDRIRRIAPDGIITTVAGGAAGFSGDGARALDAKLDVPSDVVPLTNGGFVVADTGNNRVRRVTPLGTIFTIAGSAPGLSGDGGPATQARLDAPEGLAISASGGVLIADTANQRVRGTTDTGALPAPVVTRSIGFSPGAGAVLVRPPGSFAFIPLREQDIAANGSVVQAAGGSVDISVQKTNDGPVTAMRFAQGDFSLRQGGGSNPITDVRLTAPLDGCPTTSTRAGKGRSAHVSLLARSSARKKRSRYILARGKGRFRTRGRYASALVRGTSWTTLDRCDSTLVRVTTGLVEVRDQVKRRTVFVSAGRSYVARRR